MTKGSPLKNKEFSRYQEYIVSHINYQTLPNKKNSFGEITWVKVKDFSRTQWWDKLKVNLKLKDRASVARKIHPPELGGYKPCQVCGRKMSIHPVYPDLRTIQKLNMAFPDLHIAHFGSEISEISLQVESIFKERGLKKLSSIFNYSGPFKDSQDLAKIIINEGKKLSPGVMSNAPDRLDGFHTYNACCRSVQDTGRHASNLSRYSTDRRAYENWADGNWRGADRLMGKFKSSKEFIACPSCGEIAKMSADHIGPISLGFTHRMAFLPLCKECNSKKNNRMTLNDVKNLLNAEKSGEVVISWHSKSLWNSIKGQIKDDDKALEASKLLRKNMHYVMCIFSDIFEAGHEEFLSGFLHPEFAAFDYEFTTFDVKSGKFTAVEVQVNSLNTRKQAKRYLRISFNSLAEYNEKENRKSSRWKDKEADRLLLEVIGSLDVKNPLDAKTILDKLFDYLANELSSTF